MGNWQICKNVEILYKFFVDASEDMRALRHVLARRGRYLSFNCVDE